MARAIATCSPIVISSPGGVCRGMTCELSSPMLATATTSPVWTRAASVYAILLGVINLSILFSALARASRLPLCFVGGMFLGIGWTLTRDRQTGGIFLGFSPYVDRGEFKLR